MTLFKRIFLGAKFATITVCLPIKSSGWYADLIPANTWRVSPFSLSSNAKVNRSNLSAFSTCSALTKESEPMVLNLQHFYRRQCCMCE